MLLTKALRVPTLTVRTRRYEANGAVTGEMEIKPPAPIRLQWDIKNDCQEAIETALKTVDKLIAEVDLRIYVHDDYGKGFMKECRLSPDAYIQMALQLAYYRNAGKFDLTYEASMTRLFREGRTETVRPCTVESSAWVTAMEDEKSTTADRVRLLKIACENHQVGRSFAERQNLTGYVFLEGLPRRHVWKGHRQTPVLPVRRFQVPRSRFSFPAEGAERALEVVDVADSPRSDEQVEPEQVPQLHIGRRRIRSCSRRRLRGIVHNCRRKHAVLPHLQQEEQSSNGNFVSKLKHETKPLVFFHVRFICS